VSRAIRLDAPAKINLTLEVLGRRPDGYHELRSVFATLDLADRVRVAAAKVLDVRVRPDPGAPVDGELAARAVAALAEAAGRPALAHVRITKRIPVAAGLGGGSSDAGAVLRGLARVWRTGADLLPIATGLGSDVPFFASGAAFALVEGRGERVTALPAPREPLWIVLVRVAARVPTAAVFAALRPADEAHRERTTDGRSVALAAAFEARTADPATIREHLRNDLLDAASRVCRDIGEARLLAGAKGATLALSGSGPSLFAVADSRQDALRLARSLRGQGLDARARRLGPSQRASAVLLPS
jgi:4-diphosphocytidyl-2-C-methyl-D-erythritol kinase